MYFKINSKNHRVMKAKYILWFLALAVLAVSCIPSLHPLYTEKDLKTDDRLVGTWKEVSREKYDTYTWKVTRKKAARKMSGFLTPASAGLYEEPGQTDSLLNYYHVVSGSRSVEDQAFSLHLVELGGRDFIDLYPTDWDVSHEFLSWHLVEMNVFSRIEITQDTLFVKFLDRETLEGLIRDDRIRITHLDLNGRILITASTGELQEFMRKYGGDPRIYMPADTLVRADSDATFHRKP